MTDLWQPNTPVSGADRALVAGATEPVSRLGPTGFDHGELLALALRCEQASGPNRELDAAIAGLFSNSVESDDGDFWWGPYDALPERVPAFTASVDAAITLVSPGWLWTMDSWSVSGWACGIWRGSTWLVPNRKERQSRTPALALCAASLRARAGDLA